MKSIFQFFKKRETIIKEKPTWRVHTIEMDRSSTERFTLAKKNVIVALQGNTKLAPFPFYVLDDYASDLCEKLEEIRQHCAKKKYECSVSPFINSFYNPKKIHIYIDPNKKNNQVYDLNLYLNKKEVVDSFSLGTRKRMYAYLGETPFLIEKSDLSEFQEAVDYIKTYI